MRSCPSARPKLGCSARDHDTDIHKPDKLRGQALPQTQNVPNRAQVFDKDLSEIAAVNLGRPASAACLVDDAGTLVAAIGRRIVVASAPAAAVPAIPSDSVAGLPTVSSGDEAAAESAPAAASSAGGAAWAPGAALRRCLASPLARMAGGGAAVEAFRDEWLAAGVRAAGGAPANSAALGGGEAAGSGQGTSQGPTAEVQVVAFAFDAPAA